jgi:hypothetical protein
LGNENGIGAVMLTHAPNPLLLAKQQRLRHQGCQRLLHVWPCLARGPFQEGLEATQAVTQVLTAEVGPLTWLVQHSMTLWICCALL